MNNFRLVFLVVFLPAFLTMVCPLQANGSEFSVFQVQEKQIVNYYEAVGTVRSQEEPEISSQVQAEVLEVLVNPGDQVQSGKLMIRLDDREFKSRLHQAVEQFQAARAAEKRMEQESVKARALLDEVSQEYERHKNLYAGDVISRQEYEKVASAYYQASAGYEQSLMARQEALYNKTAAQKKTEELKVLLEYTEIKAPGQGQVVRRMVHPGEVTFPGKVLLKLQSRHLLRMEAYVPERLISRIALGEEYEIRIDSLQKTLNGRVIEIVPQADAATRSFLVKLDIEPGLKEIYPGMFARMFIPVDHEDVILVPASAVHFIGQLQTVRVLENGETEIRHVRTGRKIQDLIEILSGLNAGEKIIIEKDGAL